MTEPVSHTGRKFSLGLFVPVTSWPWHSTAVQDLACTQDSTGNQADGIPAPATGKNPFVCNKNSQCLDAPDCSLPIRNLCMVILCIIVKTDGSW